MSLEMECERERMTVSAEPFVELLGNISHQAAAPTAEHLTTALLELGWTASPTPRRFSHGLLSASIVDSDGPVVDVVFDQAWVPDISEDEDDGSDPLEDLEAEKVIAAQGLLARLGRALDVAARQADSDLACKEGLDFIQPVLLEVGHCRVVFGVVGGDYDSPVLTLARVRWEPSS
ncbi:hypothetical protein [Streptomyces sp. NPDC092307]|uniref:hypothetical protein n=1 Tax=Streptomyces sp. NPDC092307 TaxID=3366013 RepID=UPI0037F22BEC